MKPANAPRLAQWMNASEIAEALGISRQTVNQMIRGGDFKSLHLSGLEGRKGQYMVKRSEVEKMKGSREFPRSTAKE